MAASSISGPSCSIALIPAREANGKYFTDPINTSKINVPYKLGRNKVGRANIDRYIAPKAIAGIRYGKNARLFTSSESFVPRRLTMAYPAKTPTEPAMMEDIVANLTLFHSVVNIVVFLSIP